MKSIAILGSTGSIGTQALEVISQHMDKFHIALLSANNNVQLLAEQAVKFKVPHVVILNPEKKKELTQLLKNSSTKVHSGEDALCELVAAPEVELVLTAIVGYAGLRSTIAAISAGKNIALANKETLVVAGELVSELARKHHVDLLPVDSEHSAIFQCLQGESLDDIHKLILTASGGPFRGFTKVQLEKVSLEQALKHPNWEMGAKITIDSATLMNKGLEVIEARWLFDIPASKIQVVVHPQSIIHSAVEFVDGSLKAQLGLPDMKVPIQYAFSYPERLNSDFPRFNFMDYPSLTFEEADITTFKNLGLAFQVLETAGNAPCILNAANEVVVDAFLNKEIGFLAMSEVIEESLRMVDFIKSPSMMDYVETDREARKVAISLLKS